MSPHARETRPFASEVKFIIDPATGAAIRDWIRTQLEADPHGAGPFNDEYRTTSLYFDNDKGDVFHQRRSFGRSKYRVRRYGTLPYVFLERKLRKPGILVKRRTTVDIEELSRLADDAPDSGWPGEWFHRRVVLRQIHPVCQLSYARIARFARTIEGPVRLTLDSDVRAARADEPRFLDEWGRLVLDDRMVLELKYRRHVPAIFKQLVETFALEPRRASKYRLGIAALGESAFLMPGSPAADAGTGAHA
jgi:hypothetical protein